MQENKNNKDVVLAIDGNSLLHRAYHAYSQSALTNKDGDAVFAIYGFLALLCGIIDKVQPTKGIVVGFDSRNNERKKIEPLYKATRSAKDPDLYAQLNALPEILKTLGIHAVSVDGWEADDVIGSTARAAEEAGIRCVIATSDRDAFSQISDATTVLRLVSGLDNAVWFTPSMLQEKYGIKAGCYLDYAAVRGDKSDNLEGVRGIGDKGAAKLLETYSCIEDAITDPELVSKVGKVTAAKLLNEESLKNFRRNMQIMSIRRDLPIDLDTAHVSTTAEKVDAVVNRWGLPSLRMRLIAHLVAGEQGKAARREEEAPDSNPTRTQTVQPTERKVTKNILTPPSQVVVSHLMFKMPQRSNSI